MNTIPTPVTEEKVSKSQNFKSESRRAQPQRSIEMVDEKTLELEIALNKQGLLAKIMIYGYEEALTYAQNSEEVTYIKKFENSSPNAIDAALRNLMTGL